MSEPNDRMLDEYLRRDSLVSQRYRELDADEVPSELDDAVLAQARAAVAPRRKQKPTWIKWGAPLALAACGVMAVAIVLEIGVQEQVRLPSPQLEQEIAASASAPDISVEQAPAAEAPSAQTPAADTPTADAPAQVAQVPYAPSAAETVQASQAQSEPLAGAPPPVAEQVAQARRAAEAVRERRAPEGVRAAQPPAAPPQTAQAQPSTDDAVERSISQPIRTMTTERPIAPPPPQAATTEGAVAQAPPRLAPEAWLEQIRELRRDGKVLEADEQWRDFIEVYPVYEVDPQDAARPAVPNAVDSAP